MSEHPVHIGFLSVEILIPQVASLKGKRAVLQSAIKRLRNKFNISVSEIDFQNLWQRAVLGIVVIGTDKSFLNSILDKIINHIETFHDLELTDYAIEFI